MCEKVKRSTTEQHTPGHTDCPVCARINARIKAHTRGEIIALVENEMNRGDPRSDEYLNGVVDLVCARVLGTPFPAPARYHMGSVQADAYYAGVERGWSIWERLGERES